jgi:hypothetical protein
METGGGTSEEQFTGEGIMWYCHFWAGLLKKFNYQKVVILLLSEVGSESEEVWFVLPPFGRITKWRDEPNEHYILRSSCGRSVYVHKKFYSQI